MLESIGLDPGAEEVYRALLHTSPATVGELAQALGQTPGRTRQALGELTDAGLVEAARHGKAFVARDPKRALPALVRERRSALDRIDLLVEELHAEFRERSLRSDPAGLVEILEGPSQIGAQIELMLSSAQREVRALDSPPYVTPNHTTTELELAALARGVACRAVYAATVLEMPDYFEQLRIVSGAGEQARIMPRVPMKMIIGDDREALLPLTASDTGTRSSAIVVRASRLLDALASLFELLWSTAVSIFDDVAGPTPDGLSADELVVLKLLHTGLTDDAIARQLGVSERTVRRRISELVERLGASSRFQAGAQAVRRGWL